jgi:hypothetical protein
LEAELAALNTTTIEAEWLRELLMDLPVVEKPIPAILMNCDNQTVIAKVTSSKDNWKSSRHVKRRLKFVRKLINSRVISVTYISTDKNLADPFTKVLGTCSQMLRIKNKATQKMLSVKVLRPP